MLDITTKGASQQFFMGKEQGLSIHFSEILRGPDAIANLPVCQQKLQSGKGIITDQKNKLI